MDVHLLEVASGVFHVRAQHVGWVMITEGSEVTLVDTGYPGDRERLLRSLRRIGRRPSDVAAILLTHAHPDQLGSAEYLRSTEETPVLVHPDEVDDATGRSIEQVRKPRVLLRAWRPSVALWASDVIGLKARKVDRLTSVDTFDAEPLDVPGRPRPVHTPGHTSGHCVFHLPDRAALLAGDALMTAHAVSRSAGTSADAPVLQRRLRSCPGVAALHRRARGERGGSRPRAGVPRQPCDRRTHRPRPDLTPGPRSSTWVSRPQARWGSQLTSAISGRS